MGITRVLDFDFGNETRSKHSPDGSMLLFSSSLGGDENVFLLKKKSGDTVQLTHHPGRDSNPVWSPDGKQIAFTSYRDGIGIWTMDPFHPESLKRISPDSIIAEWPDWSPDGKSIIFSGAGAGSRDIWSIDLADSNLQQITNHPDNEWIPRWSPNGKKIAFYTTWNNKMTDICVIDPDGKNLKQLTNNPSEDFGPMWGPEGKLIYFSSRRFGRKTDILSVNVSSGNIQRHTENLGIYGIDQIVGDSIFFSYEESDNHIYEVSTENGEIRKVTNGPSKYTNPTVSKSESKILAVTDAIGNEDATIVLDFQGSTIKEISTSEMFVNSANWANEPNKVLAIMSEGGWLDTNNIWSVDLKTDSIQKITETGYVQNVVSGNEDVLYFTGGGVNRENLKLWEVNASTKEMTLLHNDGNNVVVSDFNNSNSNIAFTSYKENQAIAYCFSTDTNMTEKFDIPFVRYEGVRWSPDGRQISFKGKRKAEDPNDLFIMDLANKSIKRLTEDAHEESWPSWSADGKSIFYSVRKSTLGVYSLKLDAGVSVE